MAVATKRWSDSKLTLGVKGWTAEESWDVYGATSKADAADTAVGDGSSHPDNSLLLVQTRAVDANGFNLYRVTASYSTDQAAAGGGGGDNPLLQPPTMFWEIGRDLIPVDRDTDGNPIVNSAGYPIAQPATSPRSTAALIYRRNEPFFNVVRALKYSNKVGQRALSIKGAGSVGPGQSFCDYIRPIQEYTADSQYVRVEYRFEFRDGNEPFQLRVPDLGRWGFRNTAGTTVPGEIVDSRNGQPVTFDVRLDGSGKPIDQNFKIGKTKQSPVDNPLSPLNMQIDEDSTDALTILVWRTAYTVDLNELNL